MNDTKYPKSSWLFDIDGVLNNPKTKYTIIKPEIISLLTSKLHNREPVGLISGRALSWQLTHVVKPMENYIKEHEAYDTSIIDNLFVSGEFGVASVFHKNTVRKLVVNHKLAISESLKKTLEASAKEFLGYVWIETSKETMFTVVAHPGLQREIFLKQRSIIASRFREIVGDNPDLEVHEDRIAVNVKNKNANKHSATNQFLNWLAGNKIIPQKFYVFGDSPSDLEMGEALEEQELKFELVFVGDRKDLHGIKKEFPVTFTDKHSDEGTLEYLNRL